MNDVYSLMLIHILSWGLMASAVLGAVTLHMEFKRDGRTWQFALSLFLTFIAATTLLGYAHFLEYLIN